MKEMWANLSMKAKVGVIAGGSLLLLVVLALIPGADEPAPDAAPKKKAPSSSSPTPTATEKREPEYDGAAYAKKVQKEMAAALGNPISESCDYGAMTWHCFFDRYESPQPGWVSIRLGFPGDFDRDEQKAISEAARMHTFNLAGFSLDDLDTIVSYGNDVDTGTTRRSDVPLLN